MKQARKKQAKRQRHRDSNPNTASKYDHNSLSMTRTGRTRGHLTSGAVLGLCLLFLGLSCPLPSFGPLNQRKNLSAPKKLFLPPASFAT